MGAPPRWLRSRRALVEGALQDAAVAVEDGLIVAVEPGSEAPGDADDLADTVLFPGLVDAHVHCNEPGRSEWEGFATATRAAAVGGITTLVDMPLNSSPVTTTVAALEAKRRAARGKLWVDVGFYGGLVPSSLDNLADLEALVASGVLGIKVFLCDSGLDEFPPVGRAELEAALPILARRSLPLLAHAELLPEVRNDDDGAVASWDYATFLASRPASCELEAIRLLAELCRRHNAAVHIVHLGAAEALPEIAATRAAGAPLRVETCPHYLSFCDTDVPAGDTRFKCAPPLRDAANREGLWEGLRSGLIDTIGSDHSPCPPEMKRPGEGDFRSAWGGIASLQWLLPAVWSAARRRGVEVAALAAWLARTPAEQLGLAGRKGAIAVGRQADLVAWRPEATFRVRASTAQHRHPISPYDGMELHGVVEATWLAGRRVWDGESVEGPYGVTVGRPA